MNRFGVEHERRFMGHPRNQAAMGRTLSGENRMTLPRKLRFAQRRHEREAFAKDAQTLRIKAMYTAALSGDDRFTAYEVEVFERELLRRHVDVIALEIDCLMQRDEPKTTQVIFPPEVLAKYNIPPLPGEVSAKDVA